jgi:hypothetical protein
MGQRGRDWVLSHFNADTVADQMLSAYAEVASASAPN